jgi:hypothetical protein
MSIQQREALEWVKTGSESGWDQHRNAAGELIAPTGYFPLWDSGLVHHNAHGQLSLTFAGEKALHAA